MRYSKAAFVCLLVSVNLALVAGNSKKAEADPAHANPTISGVLFWPNGDLVQNMGVRVSIKKADCTASGKVWTDENGTFTINKNLTANTDYFLRVEGVSLDGTTFYTCWVRISLGSTSLSTYLNLEAGNDYCPEIACP